MKNSEHDATIIVENGKLIPTIDGLNLFQSSNKIIKTLPDNSDRIVSLYENKDKFQNLEFVDILLTNACNLSCTYCYEQHNKDFGRFTPELIKKVWDWLKSINNNQSKYIQFFGGEPLIHKKLILDFMRKYKDDVINSSEQTISITTNGLLLDDAFIDEYFSYPNVKLMVSLDTIDVAKDHRGISQEQLNTLLNNIEKITKKVSNPKNFAIRSTISRDVAAGLKDLWNELYKRGVRQLIFHPLILSYTEGYIEWSEDEWNGLLNDIGDIITKSPEEIHFHVAEGVGEKNKTNCLVGGDEIAVDPSGDFSGCYFFTNRKSLGTGKFLLGNIFDDSLYINRYETAVQEYEKMYEHEQCKSCNVQNLCYQCPAGNISTGEKMFRPDGMCKRFVELQASIQHLILTKKSAYYMMKFITEYKSTVEKQQWIENKWKNWSIKYYGAEKSLPSSFKQLCLNLTKQHKIQSPVPNLEKLYPDNVEIVWLAMLELLISIKNIKAEDIQ